MASNSVEMRARAWAVILDKRGLVCWAMPTIEMGLVESQGLLMSESSTEARENELH